MVSKSQASGPRKPSDLFVCQMCGECCKGYGGTFVSPGDIQRIARYIGEPVERFTETYCQMSGGHPVLAQAENGYCRFWADGVCTIHPVKPRMCRQWPFIASVIVDAGNWYAMATACPGMRTDVSPETIRATVKAIREHHPPD